MVLINWRPPSNVCALVQPYMCWHRVLFKYRATYTHTLNLSTSSSSSLSSYICGKGVHCAFTAIFVIIMPNIFPFHLIIICSLHLFNNLASSFKNWLQLLGHGYWRRLYHHLPSLNGLFIYIYIYGFWVKVFLSYASRAPQ